MTDYGPGPCNVCHEDIEAHTTAELKQCIAVDERCELTELLVSACGHCRGDNAPLPTDGVFIERFAQARYVGRCVIDRSHRIEPGDQIGWPVTDDGEALNGWACCGCVDVIAGVS